ERMTPARSLAQIAQLLLSNQHQLQTALAQPHSAGGGAADTTLRPDGAHRAAQAIEHNMHAIDQLWTTYAAAPKGPQEALLTEHFTQRRTGYREAAIKPAIAALRGLDYAATQRLTTTARVLYERDSPIIQALIDLQFAEAHAAYQAGVQRHAHT